MMDECGVDERAIPFEIGMLKSPCFLPSSTMRTHTYSRTSALTQTTLK